MDILIASDHAGFELKKSLLELFIQDSYFKKNHHLIDLGTFDEEKVDYPDYASLLASQVSKGFAKKGILICGSGVGMSIVANKFPNVRSTIAYDENTAKLAGEHNDVNVLALGGRVTKPEQAVKILKAWLNSPCTEERHQKRVNKIREIENNTKGPE